MKTPSRFSCATALATAAALFLTPLATYAGDVAGAPQVVAGTVSFGQNGNVRTINQTSGAAIINWQDFSINAGDLTRFLQPGANSAVLNRVLGFTPSLLNGQLQANGSVYLINPNGVIVGPQGRVDVGAFYASTLNVADDEFLKAGGSLRFAGGSRAGVQNLGTINATEGDVMLIAYTVRNAGTINAAKGVAGLAAGSEVLLTHQGDQRIAVKSSVSAEGLETGVENSGLVQAAQAELKAAGGSIYSLAVNQTGIVRATGFENKNGRVLLTADAGSVNVSGEISAHNANGDGGEILLGGGYQGKNSSVANAAHTTVTASAKLDASASRATGSGGQIVVWADQTTQFAGSIAARGGSAGGDGGSLEVSGKHSLAFTGTADTSAANGKKGRLLLDPDGVIISTDADQDLAGQGGFIEGTAVPSFLNNGTLNALLATTDVIVQAGDTNNPPGFNGISVNADVEWSAATALTLTSRDTIAINANINGGSTGSLILQPGTASVADGTTGAITLASNKGITVDTLSLDRSFIGSRNSDSIGAINLAGTVTATTVELVRNFGDGVTGDVVINNPANQIGTLRGTGSVGGIAGDLRVTDSAGGLSVDGDLSGVSGAVEIVTTGNLTVNSGALVKNTGASDLVLAANNGSFINNAAAAAIDASGAGRYLIYSDTPANTTKGGLTGATTYNKTYTSNAPATITATGDRFLFSLAPTLTVTADAATKTYGAANPSFTYTVTGLQAGDTLADAISGTPSLSTTATAATGAGPAAISLTNGSLALTDMGYGLSLQPGTLTINQAPLTITADNFTRIYGATNPTFTASYSGFVNGDTALAVSGLSLDTTATTASNVGSYAITASGATSSNYALTFVSGNLAINQAPLTITADNLAKTYGAANPTLTASYSGFVNGDTSSVVSGLVLRTTAVVGSNVGGYPITASGATATNYAPTFAPGNLTINQAPLTITANDASRLFGVANPTFTALFSGLVNGDNSSVVTGLSFATTANAGSAVGSYPITPSGASASNYSLSYLPGSLSISNAILTITADSFSRVYGTANPTFTASYAGFTDGDTAAIVSGLQFSTSATQNSGVGTYAITPFGATAPNYGLNFVSGSLSISPAALTIRASDVARNYGAANPTFTGTFTGLVAGDTAASIGGVQFTTPATAATGVGSYTIATSGATNPNYTITQEPGALTVNAAPLTIAADNQSKSFGAANPAFTATYTGLVNGETASVVSGLVLATTAVTQSPTGSYPITSSGATAPNYAISFLPGTFSIDDALLTITADNFSRTYGAANPAFTASYSGFAGGDTSSLVSGLRFSTTATTRSGIGNYIITPFGATAPNYSISFVPSSLSITPAALTISADSLVRTYGAANPAFTASFSGFVNGETSSVVSGLALGTTATSGSNVGAYAITGSGASATNYAISYTPGTLTVNKAPLTVSADNAGKTYGAANPAFTATYAGFVNGDTSSAVSGLSLDTSATTSSGVGGYPITPSGATSTNYVISTQPGMLTVSSATLTVAAGNASRTYGDANPGFSGGITGFVLGENSSVLTTLPTYSSSASVASNVGNYAINPGGAAAANYTFNYQPGSLAITPAILSVKADNLARVYGEANPTPTYTVSGLKNGDSADGKFFLFANGTTAAPNSPVGNYNILLTGNDTPNDNYTTFFANGTLTVQPRPLTITTDAVSRQYGLANPAFSATFAGLASFDSSGVISNLRFASPATAATGVGTSLVLPSADSNPNYAVTFLPGQLTITPAPLSVLAGGDVSRTYGDANPVFTPFITAGALYNGDTAASIGLNISTEATPASSVGKYAVTPALTSPNYALTPFAGSITILPALLNVGVANATRVYGDANPTLTAAIVGGASSLRNGDTAASIGLTATTTATPATSVGFIPLSATVTSPNYQVNITPGSGSLNITPASLSVTVVNSTRVYGDANPTDAFTATGLKNSDTAASVLALVTTASPASSIGSYSLSATLATPNYALSSLTPGTLQVTPRPVTITFFDGSRPFGDANPNFSLQIGGRGFARFDTVADIIGSNPATTTATTLSNVGAYPITLPANANANYAFTVEPGTLTITPRPVTITADSFRIGSGDALPAFTAQIMGLPGGVTAAQAFPNLSFTPTAFTSAVTLDSGITLFPEISLDPSTTVISSLINAGGYASSSNYNVTRMTPGVLTTTTKSAATELTLSANATTTAAASTKVTVGTIDPNAPPSLPAPLTDPRFSSALNQAAALLQSRIAAGDEATIKAIGAIGYPLSFPDGIAGFLSDIATNKAKQAIVVGALASLITSDALKPADQRSPELAALVSATMQAAEEAKLAQEKEAVANYDAWVTAQTNSTATLTRNSTATLASTLTGGADVPNFLGDAQAKQNAIAVASVVSGAAVGGAAAAAICGVIPASIVTFGATGTILAGEAAAALGPATAAVVCVAGSIARGFEVKKSEDNIKAIEAARTSVQSGILPSLDLGDKADLANFTSAFYGLVGTSGFSG